MTLSFRLTAVRFALAVFSLLLIPTVLIGVLSQMLPDPFPKGGEVQGSGDEPARVDLILDPGHGGMDGGAVSLRGDLEKDLNLQMSLQLESLLTLCGLRVEMTRREDQMLSAEVEGSRKMRDLAGRLAIMEAHPEALFVSIHMNRFSDPSCKGTQIWYAPSGSASRELADTVSDAVKGLLQPDNHRTSKAADEAIYLLHRAKSCAILIECGFLSNETEAVLLADSEYQTRLSASVAMGILTYLGAQEVGKLPA